MLKEGRSLVQRYSYPDSLVGRIRFSLLAASLIPIILVATLSHLMMREALKKSEHEKISALNHEAGRQIAAVMEGAVEALDSLQSNPFLTDPTRTPMERLGEMTRLVGIYDQFSDISLYDGHGDIINSTTFDQASVHERTKWFELALEGTRSISLPEIIRGEEGLFVSVYVPVYTSSEETLVMRGRIPFNGVWNVLDKVDLGEGGHLVLLDPRNNILAHPDRSKIFDKFSPPSGIANWADHSAGTHQEPEMPPYLYSSLSIASEETMVGEKWNLLALVPKEEFAGILKKVGIFQFCFATLIGIGAILFGGLFARTLSKAIILTSAEALKVAGGARETVLEETGPSEVRRLNWAFNVMVGKLRDNQRELEARVQKRTQELEKSQIELKNTASQLQAAYNSTKEGILVVDKNGEVITGNSQFSGLFGIEESPNHLDGNLLRDRLAASFTEPQEFTQFWTEMAEDPNADAEWEAEVSKPDELFISIYTAPVLDPSGEPSARLWMFQDLTEQHNLEMGLRQAQKMEAIGRLAGGVAHDFNNLLTGIIGNISLAEGELKELSTPDAEIEKRLVCARQAAKRGSELVQGLLGFSRQTNLKFKACNPEDVISDVIALTSASFDPSCLVTAKNGKDTWHVLADPTEVEQVVMNMCVNARDAMPLGGEIRISTDNVTISEEEAFGNPDSYPGDFVRITVFDDGEGIPDSVRALIFEPFFTTKEQGKGTGLGLATCYGIVKQHSGWIHCTSELGVGTKFEIFFPRTEAPESDVENIGADESEEKATPPRLKNGRILLIDDEDVVRMVAEGVLKKHGFSTTSAKDGQEALEILSTDQDFDLIMLDMTMPRLGGKETFEGIRDLGVMVPVVICSGYLVELDTFTNASAYRPEAFVQKPYDIETLLGVIEENMESGVVAS